MLLVSKRKIFQNWDIPRALNQNKVVQDGPATSCYTLKWVLDSRGIKRGWTCGKQKSFAKYIDQQKKEIFHGLRIGKDV